MSSKENIVEADNSSKPVRKVPLAPPPMPPKPGETKTGTNSLPTTTLAPGYVSFEKVDPNDPKAVEEAARKWLEAQSTRSCLS